MAKKMPKTLEELAAVRRWRVAERVRVCGSCFSEWATFRDVAGRG